MDTNKEQAFLRPYMIGLSAGDVNKTDRASVEVAKFMKIYTKMYESCR